MRARARLPDVIDNLRGDIGLAFWPVADQLMVSGANFLTSVFIARTLGRNDFGLYTLAFLYFVVAVSLQQALISSALFSLGSRRVAAEQQAYINALTLEQLGFTAVFYALTCLAVGASHHFLPNGSYVPYSFAAAGAAFLWQDFTRRVLFLRNRVRIALVCDAISFPGQLAVLFAVVRPGSGLNAVFWIAAATSALAAAAAMIWMGPLRLQLAGWRPIVAEQWTFCRWLVGATVLNLINGNIAFFAVGAILGASAVAGLRAAELLFLVGNLLYLSLENFLPAHAMGVLLEQGLPGLRRYLLRWTLLGLGVSIAISLVMVADPSLWLRLVFGRQMAGYSGLVYILAVRNPIWFLVLMGFVALRSRDATAYVMAAEGVRAAITVLTVYPVMMAFGLTGTAVAHATWPLAALVVVAVGVQKNLWGNAAPATVAVRADPPA
jgi:O-antigen/teichoic acid export membrane protein